MQHIRIAILILAAIFFYQQICAQRVGATKILDTVTTLPQQDTTRSIQRLMLDTMPPKQKFNPKKAGWLSFFVPGLGQIYNKRYWETLIVWAPLGYFFTDLFTNIKYYKMTSFAYTATLQAQMGDSTNFNKIDPQIQGLDPTSLLNYRNQFRTDRDYDIIYIAVVWGLNVADAVVFAHLKNFDVSNNLAMRIQPHLQLTNNSYTTGIGLIFTVKDKAVPRPSKFLSQY